VVKTHVSVLKNLFCTMTLKKYAESISDHLHCHKAIYPKLVVELINVVVPADVNFKFEVSLIV
jgi:hypothetical protein